MKVDDSVFRLAKDDNKACSTTRSVTCARSVFHVRLCRPRRPGPPSASRPICAKNRSPMSSLRPFASCVCMRITASTSPRTVPFEYAAPLVDDRCWTKSFMALSVENWSSMIRLKAQATADALSTFAAICQCRKAMLSGRSRNGSWCNKQAFSQARDFAPVSQHTTNPSPSAHGLRHIFPHAQVAGYGLQVSRNSSVLAISLDHSRKPGKPQREAAKMADHIVRFDCLLPRIFAVGIYSTERQQPSQTLGQRGRVFKLRKIVCG